MTTETITTGNEIINATQNAVIEAVENVAEMIENPDSLPVHEHEIFYQSAEFWVAVTFVLTIILLCKPIYKAVNAMITQNINNIRNQIDEAQKLQNDAEKLLASYERKFCNVNEETDNIIKKAQNEIEYIRKASLSHLEQEMKQKEKDVAEKLQNAKNNALKEISATATTLSIKTVKEILQNKISSQDVSKLIDTSIEKISNL